MLFGKLLGNPDDGHSIKAGSIGQQLTKVSVVSPFELVFDQNPVVTGSRSILAQYVGLKPPNILFLSLDFQVDTDGISQQSYVVFVRESGRKVGSFIFPGIAQVDALQSTHVEIRFHSVDSLNDRVPACGAKGQRRSRQPAVRTVALRLPWRAA